MKHRARFGSLIFTIFIVATLLFAYAFQDEFKAGDYALTGDLSSIVSSLNLTSRAQLILRATLIKIVIAIVRKSMYLVAIVKIRIASISIM